ncbi:MAG: type II toxin-antitoxin system PemK/MazF family toxin [Bacillota bacterium]
MKRGDVFLVDFAPVLGEKPGKKPAVIIQNDIGNEASNTTIVVPFTEVRDDLKFNIKIDLSEIGIDEEIYVFPEQITVVDKERIIEKTFRLPQKIMQELDDKIRQVLSL